jgi:polyferredoxin
MRKILQKILRKLVALAILALGLVLMWLFIREFYAVVRAANPSVAAAVIGAMATILVGIGGVLLTHTVLGRSRSIKIFLKSLVA